MRSEPRCDAMRAAVGCDGWTRSNAGRFDWARMSERGVDGGCWRACRSGSRRGAACSPRRPPRWSASSTPDLPLRRCICCGWCGQSVCGWCGQSVCVLGPVMPQGLYECAMAGADMGLAQVLVVASSPVPGDPAGLRRLHRSPVRISCSPSFSLSLAVSCLISRISSSRSLAFFCSLLCAHTLVPPSPCPPAASINTQTRSASGPTVPRILDRHPCPHSFGHSMSAIHVTRQYATHCCALTLLVLR